MKKYVPLLLSSVLAFTSIQSFTVFAEGEDDGNIEEISEEGEEKAVEDTNLRILFTSDLQDHILQYKQADNEEYVTLGGYSRLANLIQLNRTENTVLIDGGNFSTGSAFSCLNSTSAPDLSLMSMFGYDAIALGDEEFTYGTQTLANMIGVNETVPTLLTGNLNYSDSEAGKALKSTLAEKGGSTYKVIERAGKKIGIFSVMKEQSISSDDVSLANAIDTAKDIVSSLNEEGCDYVIAIAHGGDAFAHEIAKSVDDINTVGDDACRILHQPARFRHSRAHVAEHGVHRRLKLIQSRAHVREPAAGEVPLGVRLYLPNDAADVLASGDLAVVRAADDAPALPPDDAADIVADVRIAHRAAVRAVFY